MEVGPHRVADDDQAYMAKDIRGNITIYPRGFNITWGNDYRYWDTTKLNAPEMSSSVVELKQVSWLEVTCSTDMVEVEKKYKVGFTVTLRPDAFGWNGTDVYVMAKVGKSGKFSFKKVSLENKPKNKKITIPEEPLEITIEALKPQEIHLGLYEVWTQKWKGGLKIHNALFQKLD